MDKQIAVHAHLTTTDLSICDDNFERLAEQIVGRMDREGSHSGSSNGLREKELSRMRRGETK